MATALTATPEAAPLGVARTDPGGGRIASLDVLRGIALLGMLLVHFNGVGPRPDDDAWSRFVDLFLSERFFTIFAMLFGAGFGVQLWRAEVAGVAIIPRYLRRLAALAVFGFIAEFGFGFPVLLAYAMFGLPLLLVRQWSPKVLIILVVAFFLVGKAFSLAETASWVRTKGEARARVDLRSREEQYSKAFMAMYHRTQSPELRTVLAARLERMRSTYLRPMFLGSWYFPLIVIGFAAFKAGVFDRARSRKRLILGYSIFGLLSWAGSHWLLPDLLDPGPLEAASSVTMFQIEEAAGKAFGLIDPTWLAFTYAGAILLLMAHNDAWGRRLAVFAWAGRLALTNYFIQVIVLDVVFTPHGLNVQFPRFVSPLLALALFLSCAWFSGWWLRRYRQGPLESIWRAVTYWSWHRERQVA